MRIVDTLLGLIVSPDRAAGLVLNNLRKVDPVTLQELKRELMPFNARRKRWDCPRPARVPSISERVMEDVG